MVTLRDSGGQKGGESGMHLGHPAQRHWMPRARAGLQPERPRLLRVGTGYVHGPYSSSHLALGSLPPHVT